MSKAMSKKIAVPQVEVESESEGEYSDSSSYDSDDFLNPEFASILGTQQRIAALKTPAAMFGLCVPAGGELVPLIDDDNFAQTIHITMATIDVTESDSTKPVVLKVVRRPMIDMDDSDDDDDDDEDEEDDEDDEDDEIDEEELKAAIKLAAEAEEADEDDDEEEDDSEDDLEDELDMYTEEYVLCILKAGAIYQQPLDITFSEGEAIFFHVDGECDVHLTGNYMTPVDSSGPVDEYDSEDDYDEDFDEDYEDDEEDDDDYEDISDRIAEVEEATKPAASKKRRASTEAADLDAVMDDAAAATPSPALSKKDKKKLKAANGEAVAAPEPTSSGKNVSFSTDTKPSAKTVAHGVTVEDRKEGTGPSVKNGSKVSIRYVGKLQSNNKQFDANTKGKPFNFTVGKGDCIKGMEAGVVGMKPGGERRIIIPAAAGYGSQKLPEIPANSTLVFDIKLLSAK